ncbi:putative leucine-rich repeat-containing protein DDB_G0290503 [Euwallacea similis]|uniref:putative leucine-rich repeat-containing protein DDB_G0290503 n=1 Tax=Euwallacea similis TaxID=1736056 RepID=UPI00344B2793
MVNDKITLNFEIEKGEPIDRYYFSAHIKLTDESKDLLREKLGSTIQFDNLDDHFNLNHENFYIYYNKYSEHNGRSELHVRDDNGKYLTSNLPLNYYGFSMELSPDGASIADYGFYPLYAIYNPNHYDKAKEKVFDDHGELSPIASNVLDNFLSNTNSLTTQDILQNVFSQLQKKADEEAERLAREREAERQREEELNEKNEELKELVEKDEIKIFKVVKGNDLGNGHSAVVLQLDGEEGDKIPLDSSKYYIAEYRHHPEWEGDEYLNFVSPDSDILEEDSNQIGTEFTIDDEQVDEEVVVESEAKSGEKGTVGEDNAKNTIQEEESNYIDQMQADDSSSYKPALQSNRDDYADTKKALQEKLHGDEIHKQSNEKAQKDIEVKKVTMETDSSSNKTEKQTKPTEDEQETVMASVIENMDKNSDIEAETSNSVANSQHPLKIKTGSPLEVGKYKVELQVTYDDVKNFYDTVRGKYHAGDGYNYEQVMVLYNEIVRPAHNHHYELFTLDEAHVANDHLFIKGQDFGTLNDFNEMFYKSDELM